MKRVVLAIAAAALVAACSDATGPGISVSGRWAGSGGGFPWNVTFNDSAGRAAGIWREAWGSA